MVVRPNSVLGLSHRPEQGRIIVEKFIAWRYDPQQHGEHPLDDKANRFAGRVKRHEGGRSEDRASVDVEWGSGASLLDAQSSRISY